MVCSGDQFVLTCSSSTSQLLWTVAPPLANINEAPTIAVLQSGAVSPPNVTVNHALYRVSVKSTSPLTAEIITENVMANVNGTIVTCSSSEAMTTPTTIIFLNGMVSFSRSCTLGDVYAS